MFVRAAANLAAAMCCRAVSVVKRVSFAVDMSALAEGTSTIDVISVNTAAISCSMARLYHGRWPRLSSFTEDRSHR